MRWEKFHVNAKYKGEDSFEKIFINLNFFFCWVGKRREERESDRRWC